uniref:4-hydroxy-4-methyl-2-oxoglutarate aldolase n=1 Tax=Polytomella parva TaxID=51329 RepID=A0A7S0VJ91_9CHLO|mmetsp:Transcript_7344/g.14477  ORF Transcript_7344/g.14477 Transcript_7344/m.14477 type:complete len:175 (+) Transcript_7344:83-607(+)
MSEADRKGTADLCDKYLTDPVDIIVQSDVRIAEPLFSNYGGNKRFSGQAVTIKCYENNPLVRKMLMEEPGNGRVLVVDGGASKRCALLGDMLAEAGMKNGWKGIIVNGCIRDSEDISNMAIGVKALATYPLKSSKRDTGLLNVPVTFAGVTISPGEWIYADLDGIIVSKLELTL